MKTCSRSPLVPLWFLYVTMPVLEAQEIKVWPEVTGYLGHDVTLPCQFVPGPNNDSVAQVQWDLNGPDGARSIILASNRVNGVSIGDTSLKVRVEVAEQSLIIRDVEMGDAGSYICMIATFPSGTFEGATLLVVKDQMPILPRMIAAGVFVLIVVTIFATTYFTIRKMQVVQ